MATALAQTTQFPICSVEPRQPANGRSVRAPAGASAIARGVCDAVCGDVPTCASPPPPRCFGQGEARIVPSRTESLLPEGSRYPGVLVADILEYRILRSEGLRLGSRVSTADADRCAVLEASLRSRDAHPHDGRPARAYHRFSISLPAWLVVTEEGRSKRVEVRVENMSAGGVKLRASLDPPKGQSVALLLEHPDGALVRLPARVAWGDEGDALGLMFAGAPVWGAA